MCWDDNEPLEEVLIAIEPVAPERYQELVERGRAAFEPPTPAIAVSAWGSARPKG